MLTMEQILARLEAANAAKERYVAAQKELEEKSFFLSPAAATERRETLKKELHRQLETIAADIDTALPRWIESEHEKAHSFDFANPRLSAACECIRIAGCRLTPEQARAIVLEFQNDAQAIALLDSVARDVGAGTIAGYTAMLADRPTPEHLAALISDAAYFAMVTDERSPRDYSNLRETYALYLDPISNA